MKNIIFTVLLVLGLIGLVPGIAAADNHKVTICHATSSATNPYVQETVAKASIVKGHAHAAHHDPGDIIPPFDDYAGRNWTPEGQAVHANDCQAPTTAPPVTETPVTETPEKPVTETPVVETPVVDVPDAVPATPVIPVTPAVPVVPAAPETPVIPEKIDAVPDQQQRGINVQTAVGSKE